MAIGSNNIASLKISPANLVATLTTMSPPSDERRKTMAAASKTRPDVAASELSEDDGEVKSAASRTQDESSMRFKELKAWLTTFEASQKDPFHKGSVAMTLKKSEYDLRTIKQLPSTVTAATSPTSSHDSASPRQDVAVFSISTLCHFSDCFDSDQGHSISRNGSLDEKSIQTKPSMATACSSTDNGDESTQNEEGVIDYSEAENEGIIMLKKFTPSDHGPKKLIGRRVVSPPINNTRASFHGKYGVGVSRPNADVLTVGSVNEAALSGVAKASSREYSPTTQHQDNLSGFPATTVYTSTSIETNGSPYREKGVSAAIRQFGEASGGRNSSDTRKSLVDQRKDQLQKRWKETTKAKPLTKVKWGVCDKTGAYKKKYVVDLGA
jgi:hypothetical protein